MTLEELKLVLTQCGVATENLKPFREHQVQIPCPLAPWLHDGGTDSHPSLSIRFGVPGSWTVFKCWSCKEQGKLWNLVDSLAVFSKNELLATLALKLLDSDKPSLAARFGLMEKSLDDWFFDSKKHPLVEMNPKTMFRTMWPAWADDRSRTYLEKRKVSERTAAKFHLLFDDRKDRIVFPVYNKGGGLVGAVGRAIEDSEPRRYYNYFEFSAGYTVGGWNHTHPEFPRIIVTEGFFDILRTYQWCWDNQTDIVCTWRAEMTEDQASIISGLDKTVYIGYDNDKAGQEGWIKAQEYLRHTGCGLKRLRLPERADLGGLDEESFLTIYNECKGALR